MPDIILPSKLVSERVTVTFDFQDELAWGETIVGQGVVVTTVSGVDTAPDLLYKVAVNVGTLVTQQLHQGLPGVIYKVECTVVGSSGKQYTKWAHLAILPDHARIPPITATWFTSKIYPLEVIESIGDSGSFEGTLFLTISIDSFEDAGAILAGEMFEILQTYSIPVESVSDSGALLLGDMYEGLQTYTVPPESISDAGVLVQGSLETILITYSNYAPESISDTGALISGDLV